MHAHALRDALRDATFLATATAHLIGGVMHHEALGKHLAQSGYHHTLQVCLWVASALPVRTRYLLDEC